MLGVGEVVRTGPGPRGCARRTAGPPPAQPRAGWTRSRPPAPHPAVAPSARRLHPRRLLGTPRHGGGQTWGWVWSYWDVEFCGAGHGPMELGMVAWGWGSEDGPMGLDMVLWGWVRSCGAGHHPMVLGMVLWGWAWSYGTAHSPMGLGIVVWGWEWSHGDLSIIPWG